MRASIVCSLPGYDYDAIRLPRSSLNVPSLDREIDTKNELQALSVQCAINLQFLMLILIFFSSFFSILII